MQDDATSQNDVISQEIVWKCDYLCSLTSQSRINGRRTISRTEDNLRTFISINIIIIINLYDTGVSAVATFSCDFTNFSPLQTAVEK